MYRLLFFDPDMKLKDFHHKVFSYFRKVAKDIKDYENDVIKVDK